MAGKHKSKDKTSQLFKQYAMMNNSRWTHALLKSIALFTN